MKANTRTMKPRNTKKVLKKTVNSAMILTRNVAGFIVQGLKTFWQNWQWALALGALLYGIFLFYYQSNVTNPQKIQDCHHQLQLHLTESNDHFSRIDKSISDLNILNAGISAQLSAIKDDTTATKNLLFKLLGDKL